MDGHRREAIPGLTVGDALGSAVEFRTPPGVAVELSYRFWRQRNLVGMRPLIGVLLPASIPIRTDPGSDHPN